MSHLEPVDPVGAEDEALETPGHWTSGARDTFANVLAERPDLSGAEFAALEQAAELISTAETLEAAARRSGALVPGSQGQLVVNPAYAEARMARTSAATILNRLVGVKAGALTNSQRGRAAANARWRSK